MAVQVNADNFVRAETDRMFGDLQRDAGGPDRFRHNRGPASIDEQTVIRMNRDTLYSFAVVNLAGGATLTLPDAGGRYLSAMVVSNDHFVPALLHDPGVQRLDQASVGTQFALVAARILVDPADPTDVAAVVAMQDEISISAGVGEPFTSPDPRLQQHPRAFGMELPRALYRPRRSFFNGSWSLPAATPIG